MRFAFRLVAATLAGVAASGCASQVDLDQMRRDQREMSRRLADTRADLDSLKSSVASLRGALQDSQHRHNGADVADLDRRLQALEGRSPAPGEVPPSTSVQSAPPASYDASREPPSGAGPVARVEPVRPSSVEPTRPPTQAAPPAAPPPGPAVSDAPRSADLERDLARAGATDYRDGLQQYQRGDYAKSIQSLRGYVNKNPTGEYVANAHYWIGESYYAQRKYNEAILEYNEILVNSPKSDRVPAALLRQASAFAELGDKIDARLILQKLTAEHPNTDEAAKAKQKLLSLGT